MRRPVSKISGPQGGTPFITLRRVTILSGTNLSARFCGGSTGFSEGFPSNNPIHFFATLGQCWNLGESLVSEWAVMNGSTLLRCEISASPGVSYPISLPQSSLHSQRTRSPSCMELGWKLCCCIVTVIFGLSICNVQKAVFCVLCLLLGSETKATKN